MAGRVLRLRQRPRAGRDELRPWQVRAGGARRLRQLARLPQRDRRRLAHGAPPEGHCSAARPLPPIPYAHRTELNVGWRETTGPRTGPRASHRAASSHFDRPAGQVHTLDFEVPPLGADDARQVAHDDYHSRSVYHHEDAPHGTHHSRSVYRSEAVLTGGRAAARGRARQAAGRALCGLRPRGRPARRKHRRLVCCLS